MLRNRRRDAGAVMVMALGDAASPITACAMGMVLDGKSHHDHRPIAQGKTMAEPHETQQEKETRWAAQRAAHDRQQQEYQASRTRRIGRNWFIVGAIVIIVAVIAAAMLL
jgi:Flp pilus assembly protein TadB